MLNDEVQLMSGYPGYLIAWQRLVNDLRDTIRSLEGQVQDMKNKLDHSEASADHFNRTLVSDGLLEALAELEHQHHGSCARCCKWDEAGHQHSYEYAPYKQLLKEVKEIDREWARKVVDVLKNMLVA